MHYGQSRDQSAEILRLVLPLMAQQQAGFHPASFTLWYEHVAGVNPELSSYLNARLDAKQPPSDDEVYQLYARHIVARDARTLEDLQQRLRTLLEQAVEITAQAGDQTGQFERSLTDNQTRLDAADTLESASEVVASLLSESRNMQALTHALVEKLDLRAQEVGDLRQALEKAQAEALQDPLTGLKNRRAFEAAVREISQESADGLRGAALLLLDIDHFKQVNDTYGHLLGDKVLRAVAHVLQSNVKGRDIVARVGGEELPCCCCRRLPPVPWRWPSRSASRSRRDRCAAPRPGSIWCRHDFGRSHGRRYRRISGSHIPTRRWRPVRRQTHGSQPRLHQFGRSQRRRHRPGVHERAAYQAVTRYD